MTNGHELTKPDAVFRKIRRLRLWSVALLSGAVVLVVAAFVFGPGLYHQLSRQRALGFVVVARQAIAAGKWDEAGPHIKAALGFAPLDLAVLRITAEFCEHAGATEAVNYRSQAAAAPGATREDRRQFARTAIDFQSYDAAARQLDRLLAEDPQDVESLKIKSALLFFQGDEAGAIRTAEFISGLAPQDRMAEYALGTLLFESADPSRQARGNAILWSLAFSPSPQKALAIRRLATLKTLTASERQLLLKEGDLLAKPSLLDQLACLTLRLAPGIPDRSIPLGQAVQLGTGRGLGDKALIAAWLNDNGGFEELLKLLPLSEIAGDLECLTWRLTALTARQRWDEIDELMVRSNLAIPEFMRFAGKAMLAARTGDRATARADLDAAVVATNDNVTAGLFVIKCAEKYGFPEPAMAVWARLMQRPEFIRRGWREILRLARETDGPEALIPAAKRLLQVDPTDTEAMVELTYVELVTGHNAAEVTARLQPLAQAAGAPRELVAVQALAVWRTGAVDDALQLLESRVRPTVDDPVRIRVIAALLFGANHQRRATLEMMRSLQTSKLWLCEQELLRP